jgi:hypothetical protein
MKPLTRAEHTALLLHQATQSSPVMIPGARDARGDGSIAQPAGAAEPHTRHAQAAVVPDRERLEHEREGGGAPSERVAVAGVRRATMLARLWRSVFHPTELAVIWTRAVPQPR